MAREQSANNSLKTRGLFIKSLVFFSVEANYVSQKDSDKSEKTFDYYQIQAKRLTKICRPFLEIRTLGNLF